MDQCETNENTQLAITTKGFSAVCSVRLILAIYHVKKIQSLSEQSITDLKTIEKLGDLEHLEELNGELKKVLESGELESINPMLPPYIVQIRKNIGFMIGNYRSTKTHAINRSKDLTQLNEQLSHIKR